MSKACNVIIVATRFIFDYEYDEQSNELYAILLAISSINPEF